MPGDSLPAQSAETLQESTTRSMSAFFTIWTGQAFSLFGSRLVQFSLVWWLTKESGSATVLALASMMALLPQVVIGPFAGALVDRWNRRVLMMVSDGLIALVTVGLAALYALGVVQVWHIYALMFLRSLGGAFQWPAMQAATTMLVSKEHLSRVGGLNQALQGLARIVAPPLGALLLEVLPMQAILAIDVATALPAIGSLLFIAIPQPAGSARASRAGQFTSVLADLRAGLRFVWGWPALLMVITMGLFINLLMHPALTLMPLLVTDHFHGGALELAWMQSAVGIGMVVGGFTLALWGGFERRAVTALLGLMLRGAGLLLIWLVPGDAFLLAVCVVFFTHFMTPIIDGCLLSVIQTIVPPEMQGRVLALLQSGSTAAVPLGLIIAGPLADALGVRFWFLISGLVTMAVGTVASLSPTIMRIEDTVGQAEETS